MESPNERRMKALLTFNLNFAEVALHKCSENMQQIIGEHPCRSVISHSS